MNFNNLSTLTSFASTSTTPASSTIDLSLLVGNVIQNDEYDNTGPIDPIPLSTTFYCSITVILCIVTILATPSNFLVIWVVIKTPVLRAKGVNMLIVNLCLIDLITSCLDSPLLLVILQLNRNRIRYDKILCEFQLFIHTFSISGQFLSFVSVGYERYHTVSNPFDKERVRKITHLLVFSCWMLAIVTSILKLKFVPDTVEYAFCKHFKNGSEHSGIIFLMIPFGIVCFVLVAFFYARIVWLIRIHCKNVNTTFRKYPISSGTSGADPTNGSDLPSIYGDICVLDSKNRSLGKRKIEAETAKRSFFVLISFLAFTLPYPMSIIMEKILNHSNRIWFELQYCLNVMSLLSSVLNPLIYGLANRQFRAAFRKILHRYYRRYKTRDYL